MAQSKKVSSPGAASKAAKAQALASKPSALKHKSAGVGKPVARPNAKTAAPAPALAAKPAAAATKTKSAVPAKKTSAAKPAVKVDVKPVAKTATKTPTKASATVAPAKSAAKAAPKAVAKPQAAVKAIPAKVAPVAPAASPPKSVFNKESVRAAAPTAAMPAAVAKPAAQRITAPVAPKAAAVKAVPVPAVVVSAAAAAAKKSVSARHGFKTNEYIVYPAHGVGRIVGIEEQEIAGMALELFVITFDKDKMTLRVPTGKLTSVGMRKLAEEPVVRRSMETLKGRARVKRTMWSRRAQEYEAKINSGDLVAIAEVVRDLYRSESQPEQSYSERQLYEAALDRMSREIAAVDKIDERGAVQRITEILAKSAKGRRLAAEGAEAEAAAADADDADEGDEASGVKAA
jgi:CarD family transcriptional regulator